MAENSDDISEHDEKSIASTEDDENESYNGDRLSVTNESVKSNENSLGDDDISKENAKLSKSRVPSALTQDNVKKYEKETDPIGVAELMKKSSAENPYLASTQYGVHSHQKSPSTKVVTRGHKFTGEAYEAITVDVQTDESWLWQLHTDRVSDQASNQPSTRDGKITPRDQDMGSHSNSDHSNSEMLDETDNKRPRSKAVKSPKMKKSPSPSRTPTQDDTSFVYSSESDSLDDDNPVAEINLSGSEYGGSTSNDMSQYSIPSVGPPVILQYKAESKDPKINYNLVKVCYFIGETHSIPRMHARLELFARPANSLLYLALSIIRQRKGLLEPSLAAIPEDLNWEDLSNEEKQYYGEIMKEMRKRKQKESKTVINQKRIDIDPHEGFGNQEAKKIAKERHAEKVRIREAEKQKQANVSANQANFYAFARQLKTVNYQLSSDKCMEDGWTLRPDTPPLDPEPDAEFFVQDSTTDARSGKRYYKTYVEKYYDNGQIFLAVFPDGSGTVWYPSGNVAITIVGTEKVGKLLFLLQEDKDADESPKFHAIFDPRGNCTCYYPSGDVRINLTALGGECFSVHGERVKKWLWRGMQTHVHAPPFQPITFGLSKQAGVRIMSQEHIFVTFSDGKRSVRFNVGTRLRLKQPLPKTATEQVDLNEMLLKEKVTYIQSLIGRVETCYKFPNSSRRHQIKLPNYLTNELERATRIRKTLGSRLPPVSLRGRERYLKHSSVLSSSGSFVQIPPPAPKKAEITRKQQKPELSNSKLAVSVTVN